MRRYLRSILILTLVVTIAWAQETHSTRDFTPTQLIDQFWKLATQGDLLTANGWERARGFYSHSTPPPVSKSIDVVSNVWGPASQKSLDGEIAVVVIGFDDAGHIDENLKYIAPKETGAVKTGRLYHLVFAPTKFETYKSDGKNLVVDKTIVGPKAWQIEDKPGAPFTTVNSAIRYVLEMRKKSNDPNVIRNADTTIEKLLRLN